ncbi:outer membrane protein assembly factor BamD [Sphingomonas sp. F9_3S_D5_B_2]
MPKFNRLAALLAGCALALPLAACAHGGKKGSDTAYVARDVNTLYAAAKRTMDQGDYQTAAKIFDEVERQHPYSVWARRAQIMSAFNYYLAKKYPESISSAQRFLTIHPGNKEAPYAHYLVAMSYYQQIEDVSRDQAISQQAQQAFDELIRRYPESRYASDARLKLDLIRDHLAGKEMEVGRFYERSSNWLAASLRFRTVVDQYQTTSHTPEALERLVECYLALGVPAEAEKAAAVLGKNYPGTYWYKQAYTLIARKTPRAAREAANPPPTRG